MPRVTTRVRSRRGTKTYTCVKCNQPIVEGERFHQWTFRYGGTRYQHAEHGHPRPSQLTQSRMGEVYAELEGVQDMVEGDPEGWTKDDIRDALQNVVEVAQEIADEARSTADEHFSGGGPHAERADEMEEVVSQLEDAVQQVDDVEEPDEKTEHEFVEITHDDGTVTLRCETCDAEVTYDPEGIIAAAEKNKALGLVTPGTALKDHVDAFRDEHDVDEDEQDDDDPWYEQVREVVNGISV